MQSSSKNNQLPYAIVIGLDSMQGLQVSRILAQRGVPVIGITSNLKSHTSRTRACEKVLCADTGTEELTATLVSLGPNLRQKAVLFPCHDKSVLMISRNRQKLEPWYHIVLPPPDIVEMMVDKIRFYSYAQDQGFPIPDTYFLNSRVDAEAAAQRLTFPCLLKPPWRPMEWTQHTKKKALVAASPAELLTLYDHYHRWADVLIAQDWIVGPDANLYSCNCYFDSNAEPIVTFVARKLRQWPPETGQSCLGEECRDEVVLRESVRLFKSVNYRGLGYVEMKRDEHSGKYFIVEPNVGRPTGRSAIAEAGGVELHYTMYCDAVGLPLPTNRVQKYTGAKWIHLLRDFQSAIHYWRKGELAPREWWRSVRGRKTYALFSWRDPAPFLAALLKALPTYLSPRERGEEDY
jgi:D-aspartate ligase